MLKHDKGATGGDKLSALVELWKHTIDMQMHFNEIEWKIRSLALTLMPLVVSAAGWISHERPTLPFSVFSCDLRISTGTLVITIGMLLWAGFYFVDMYWYHPLLLGAVASGNELELVIRSRAYESEAEAGILSSGENAISKRSPIKCGTWLRIFLFISFPIKFSCGEILDRDGNLHSDGKMRVFYRLGFYALFLVGLLFQIAI